MRVKDKSIIVTGSGGGIGEGIAKRLAAEGAKVIVNDINTALGEKVVAEIKAAGGTASFFAADVTRSADVKALVDAAVQRHGKLDVMVNNAGWTHRNRPALEVSEDEFDKCYAVNMKSIYLSTIHAVPAFRANKGGSFINIASTAGVRPRPGLTWYNGSKGAVITTSKSLAAEFGPDNIRVNCINPVFNPDTGLSAEFAGGPVDDARRAKFLATIPLGRFSTALDVANAALYLASDEAAFISGVCIEVDGGRCVAVRPATIGTMCRTRDSPDRPAHRRAERGRAHASHPCHRLALRHAGKAPSRSAHQRDRPLQLPLQLLHAQGSLRQGLPLPAPLRPADLRGDHPGGPAVRGTRRAQDPPHGRRAAAAQEHRGVDRTARRAAHA